MKRLYPILSTLSVLPLSAYCLAKPDLRPGLLRRFWPESIRPTTGEARQRVWIHAASAGEVGLAEAFAHAYANRETSGEGPSFLLTTNTQSGWKAAGSVWSAKRRFPFDSYPALLRLFNDFKPTLIVCVEMELWPNLFRLARKRGVPTVVVNARMSERSAGAFEMLKGKWTEFLRHPAYFTRHDRDMENLQRAGVPLERMLVSGEMKIDILAGKIRSGEKRERWPMLLGISTHDGEEEILLDAFLRLRDLYPELTLTIAPRHQRRVPDVRRSVAGRALAVALAGEAEPEALRWADVIVEDRFGRMDDWLRRASIAFVGGSLTPKGGHNPLEPVLYGVPAMIGPHHENWKDWVGFLDDGGALSVVKNARDIVRITGVVIEERNEVLRALTAVQQRIAQQLGAVERNARLARKLALGGDPFAME